MLLRDVGPYEHVHENFPILIDKVKQALVRERRYQHIGGPFWC